MWMKLPKRIVCKEHPKTEEFVLSCHKSERKEKRLCTEVWGRFSYAGHRNLCWNLVKSERFSLLIRRGDLTRQEVSVL